MFRFVAKDRITALDALDHEFLADVPECKLQATVLNFNEKIKRED
jgi:hypothetical protein